ncbi:MAG: GlsB/YeaQ/YmgE family stress response membrane protein [Lawsonibacter sp.]
MLFRLIGSLIMGALVGWIAGRLMKMEGGLLRNMVVGIIGSFVGSAVFGLLGFYAYGWIANLVVSVAGACLFLWIGRKLFG